MLFQTQNFFFLFRSLGSCFQRGTGSILIMRVGCTRKTTGIFAIGACAGWRAAVGATFGNDYFRIPAPSSLQQWKRKQFNKTSFAVRSREPLQHVAWLSISGIKRDEFQKHIMIRTQPVFQTSFFGLFLALA